MKIVCCDTSFLYSAYAADIHTPRAITQVKGLRNALTISVLNIYELENAFRFATYRNLVSPEQSGLVLSAFESDYQEGRLVLAPVDLPKIIEEARGLSSRHTTQGGHRSFDILLVAVALLLRADQFWSFDVNQRRLAAAEGLKLNP